MVGGTLFTYLLSAFFLKFTDWSFSFGFAFIDLIAISLLWLILYPPCIENKNFIGQINLQKSTNQTTSLSLFDLFFKRGLFLILIPVIIHGTIKDGVTSWIPTFISERFGLSPSLSLIITLIIPIINLAGAYWAQYAFKLLKTETKAASVFFLISALSLILLQTLGKRGALLSGIFLAVITASMMAANTLFVNLIPLPFQKGQQSILGIRVTQLSGLFRFSSCIPLHWIHLRTLGMEYNHLHLDCRDTHRTHFLLNSQRPFF
ncbi:MFS transporter [uncultured Sphaerochaeta sp.]|uniref:MFS transporter n=1 Tax=uncultured Sphaerochaeta sp. TaxID=886478 RepID=UPI002A0A8B2B|nr:MFS transporter [uncultured Sphaerochaeta sp.]